MEKLLSVNSEYKNEYKINVTGDPLTNFLFKDYLRLIVVMFFIVGVFPALLVLYYYVKRDTIIPISKDPLAQIIAIFAIAVSILTKNLFDKVADTFSSLPKKQIFKDMDYMKFFKDFQGDLNDKRIFYVCLFIVPNLIFTPFVQLSFIDTKGMWFNKELFPFSWAYWFSILYFLWFGLSLLAWKLYIIVKYVRLLGTYDFDLQIMHPDKCGGFKSIGDLCFNINIVSLVLGVVFAGMIYFISLKEQPQILLYLILYIGISLFFFFYPIMGIHNAMQNRKTELMNKINVKIKNQNLYENIYKNGNVDKEILKKIQDIRKINSEISKIPVWPFDSETLRKFVTTTVLPVIIVITSKIIGVG